MEDEKEDKGEEGGGEKMGGVEGVEGGEGGGEGGRGEGGIGEREEASVKEKDDERGGSRSTKKVTL